MDDMQNQMNAILGNPEMMQKIMAMAQTLNVPQQETSPPPPTDNPGFQMPDIDPRMLQKLSGLAGKSNIDNNQQALLRALNPYLSHRKVEKLEKAMRAAKMARMASGFLGQGGLSMLMGR